MTTTTEFPSSALRPARRVTARRHVLRPRVAELPQVSAREEALTLVREALSYVQLKTVLSHAAPAKYGELRTMLAGLRYSSPARRAVAEELAVDGLLSLGVVGAHELARRNERAVEAEWAGQPRQNVLALAEWESRELWGGFRRAGLLDSLVREVVDARSMAEWDNSPAAGTASMPVRENAARYQVAWGITATADELVSVMYGYWLTLDDEREMATPSITGEIVAWFRETARTVFAEQLTEYAITEQTDADSVELARARSIDAERAHLAALLEDGTTTDVQGRPATRQAMHTGERARLRFIEIHLTEAFGFTGHDARARRARTDIGTDRRWPR